MLQKVRQLCAPKMVLPGGDAGAIYLAEEIFAQVASGISIPLAQNVVQRNMTVMI